MNKTEQNTLDSPAVGISVDWRVGRHVTALAWLNSLRPALPLSIEQPPSKDHSAQPMSNGELKRHMQQGGVLVNGERVAPDELIDFPVFALVFFPKSETRRTTLV